MRRVVGTVLPLLALAVLVCGVARLDRTRTIQRELQPWPDGPEYVDAAIELAGESRYRIHVAGELHPPRYPPGFSGVLSLLILAGVRPVDAPYQLNLACGLFLLGLLYAFLIGGGNAVRAGLGTLMLATLPAFSILCRTPMSDVAGACLSFGGVAALYLWAGGRGLGLGALGAWLLGLSLCFRVSNLFLAPFLVAALFAREGRGLSRQAALLVGSAGIGALLLLVFNACNFGTPLKTGYAYWLGQTPGQSFAFQNAFEYAEAFWRELTQRERELTTASIYGSGSYFGPAFLLLAGLGLAAMRRDRRNAWFLAAGAASVVPYAFYDFPDFRFLLPQLAMLCAVAAAGAGRLFEQAVAKRRWAAGTGLAAATLAAVVGWPGTRSDLELGEAMQPRAMTLNVSEPDLVVEMRRRFGNVRMLALSDLPPPLIHALTAGTAIAAPLLDEHDYRFNPAVFVFDKARRRRMIESALAEGLPVVVLCARCRIQDLELLAPPVAGRRWRVLARNQAGGGLALLAE